MSCLALVRDFVKACPFRFIFIDAISLATCYSSVDMLLLNLEGIVLAPIRN